MNKPIKSIAAGLLIAVATSVSALPSFKITGVNGVSEDYVVLGQGFAKGELAAADCLKVGNSTGPTARRLTISQKSLWNDGSVKFGILSGKVQSTPAQETEITLAKEVCPSVPAQAAQIEAALNDQLFNPVVSITIGQDVYVASLKNGISTAGKKDWILGEVSDFLSKADLVRVSDGQIHPLLNARFETRVSKDGSFLRVGIIIESSWALEPYEDIRYDVKITNGLTDLYVKTNVLHLNHSRWVKYFQLKGEENKSVKHDFKYLSAAALIPAYNPSVTMPATVPDLYFNKISDSNHDILGVGPIIPGMGTTGAWPYIGPLPAFQSWLVVSNNQKLKDYTIQAGRIAGTFQSKYRDKLTDQPISIEEYPYASKTAPGVNKTKGNRSEYLTICKTGQVCNIDNRVKDSHQPQLTYLPYLITGDHYLSEELEFWLSDNLVSQNYAYRGYEKGTMTHAQTRGQAWFLRDLLFNLNTMSEENPSKPMYKRVLANNLAKYLAQRDAPDNSGKFGYVTSYLVGGYAISPWMDDFVTFAVGEIVANGHEDWREALEWKSRFPIGRMLNQDFCSIFATEYYIPAAPGELSGSLPTKRTGDFFQTWKEIYEYLSLERLNKLRVDNLHQVECGSAQMAQLLTQRRIIEKSISTPFKTGEMVQYDGGKTGYVANMQPAIAAAASYSVDGKKAWNKFYDRPQIVWDWASENQYSIIPRELIPKSWNQPVPTSHLLSLDSPVIPVDPPVGPVTPVVPVTPVDPVVPTNPVVPVDPVTPVTPVETTAPAQCVVTCTKDGKTFKAVFPTSTD